MTGTEMADSLSRCIAQSEYPVCTIHAVPEPPGPMVCDVNEAFARLIGCPSEQLIATRAGMPPAPLGERGMIDNLRANLSADSCRVAVVWGLRRDGIAYQVDCSVLPTRAPGGEGDYLVCIYSDVNSSLAARQSLLDETEKLQALIASVWVPQSLEPCDAAPGPQQATAATRDTLEREAGRPRGGVAFIDHQRRIQRIDAAFETIQGQSADEIIGHDIERFYVDHASFERMGAQAYGRRRCDADPSIYCAVFEASRDAVMLMAAEGYFTAVNPAALALFEVHDSGQFLRGYATPAALSPTTQPDGQPSADATQRWTQHAVDCGQSLFEWYHETATGRVFPAEVQLSRIDLGDDVIVQMMVRDISEKKAAIKALQQARDQTEAYFHTAPVMILFMDITGAITEINEYGCELIGLPREAIVGTRWFDAFLPAEEKSRLEGVFAALRRGDTQQTEYHENHIVTAKGEKRVIAFRNAPFRDTTGQVTGILASGVDITRQREAEAHLEYRAAHDELTGVWNRWRMIELLNAEMQRVQRHGGVFSLILFDVDHFKRVNDRYGHDAGDTVLQTLAALANQRLRRVDALARWGGEEFLVLLPATDEASGYKVAEALRCGVEGADLGVPTPVTISLGVVGCYGHETLRALIKRVDDCMYAGKRAGRNRTVQQGPQPD
ncbi:diguanylate cyclase [Spiribacter roseus]|uniref:sensor domain-containing diguanylate cyclase n=1 Tax=Spiribacter roseus TaxID=1855875 RepID=UPI001330E98B|nr:diguanylate cyclase [Spiribacter roseus]